MAFSITSVNIDKIPENGGHEIQILGTFEIGVPYEVYIGVLHTSEDSKCYSGKPGQGDNIYAWTAGIIRCYTPILPPGTAVCVTVQDMDTTETHVLLDVLTTTNRQFRSTVFGLRKVLPIFYKTGPRDIEAVPPVS